jgi:hypothetical protein
LLIFKAALMSIICVLIARPVCRMSQGESRPRQALINPQPRVSTRAQLRRDTTKVLRSRRSARIRSPCVIKRSRLSKVKKRKIE